jgi:hypothetical protein
MSTARYISTPKMRIWRSMMTMGRRLHKLRQLVEPQTMKMMRLLRDVCRRNYTQGAMLAVAMIQMEYGHLWLEQQKLSLEDKEEIGAQRI